jgi:hypothetical protein
MELQIECNNEKVTPSTPGFIRLVIGSAKIESRIWNGFDWVTLNLARPVNNTLKWDWVSGAAF